MYIAGFNKVPVVEETIVPQIYTPMEENEGTQNPIQDRKESQVSVEVDQATMKITVSEVTPSAGKEKSMSPPVLQEESEMNELEQDGDKAPIIEAVEEPTAGKSKNVIDVEIEEVAVSPSKKGRGKGKKLEEEVEPVDKKRRGRGVANTEETPSRRRTRGSKTEVNAEVEENVENVEAEEVSDEELVVNKTAPKQYGRAKKEKEDNAVVSTPDTGRKGRGRGKKEEIEETQMPKKGRGRRKKEEVVEEIIDDDDDDGVEVIETPRKGRGRQKKEEIKQDLDEVEETTPVKGRRGRSAKSETPSSAKVTRKAVKDEENIQDKSPRGRGGRSKKAADPEVQIENAEDDEYELMKNEAEEVDDSADISKEEEDLIKEDSDEDDTPLANLKRGRVSDEMEPGPSTSGTVKKMKLESEEVYEHVIEDDGLDETKEELEEGVDFEEAKEEEEEVEEEEIMEEDDEQQEVLIYRNRTSLSQGGEILIAQPMAKPTGDPYSFDQMEESTPKPALLESKVENLDSPMMKTFSTQTPIDPVDPNDFVEVVTFNDVPGKRTVMTQTDPKLRRKKFGPIGAEGELDYDMDDYSRKRRKREDELGLFEDMENRRRSFKRNAEEALKCPFCDKGFIGMLAVVMFDFVYVRVFII